jgi:hypothetical protein
MLDVVLFDVKFQEGVGGNREQRVEAIARALKSWSFLASAALCLPADRIGLRSRGSGVGRDGEQQIPSALRHLVSSERFSLR